MPTTTAMDFFFISAGLSIWIIMALCIFTVYKMMRLITKTEIEVESIKNSLKLRGLNLLSKLLGLTKGGEKHDSKE